MWVQRCWFSPHFFSDPAPFIAVWICRSESRNLVAQKFIIILFFLVIVRMNNHWKLTAESKRWTWKYQNLQHNLISGLFVGDSNGIGDSGLEDILCCKNLNFYFCKHVPFLLKECNTQDQLKKLDEEEYPWSSSRLHRNPYESFANMQCLTVCGSEIIVGHSRQSFLHSLVTVTLLGSLKKTTS